jgi:hypothetical protein
MSLGPAGGIVRLAANREARWAHDYRCVSKAATIATPMPSWIPGRSRTIWAPPYPRAARPL